MKWNMVFGALVVSVGLCGQSFGFELLDRMLGVNNYGGCCQPSCCEQTCAAEPACGCAAEPSCGVVEPSCGCDVGPSCGTPCCGKRHDLFGGLRGLFACHKHKHGCGSACGCEVGCAAEPACGCAAEPTCGCDAAPACGYESACGCPKKGRCKGLFGFLARKNRCNSCCEVSSCGCDTGCSSGCTSGCDAGAPAGNYGQPSPAVEGHDAAPMPPAPMADPSAYNMGRRVIQQSKYVRTR